MKEGFTKQAESAGDEVNVSQQHMYRSECTVCTLGIVAYKF